MICASSASTLPEMPASLHVCTERRTIMRIVLMSTPPDAGGDCLTVTATATVVVVVATTGLEEGHAEEAALTGDERPLGRIAVEAALDGVHHGRVLELREGDFVVVVHDGHQLRHERLDVLEGRVPVDHLVQDAPQGPDVARAAQLELARPFAAAPQAAAAAATAAVVFDGLRGHVVERPHLRFAVDVRGVLRGDLLGDPEVDELEVALHEQEVGWLEVPVHDARVVDDLHGRQHLLPGQPHEVGRQAALALVPLQQAVEVRLAGLHDDVHRAPRRSTSLASSSTMCGFPRSCSGGSRCGSSACSSGPSC